MTRKLFVLVVLLSAAGAIWAADVRFPAVALQKWFYTASALAGVYLAFNILLEGTVARHIKEAKTRYAVRKAASFLSVATGIIIVLRIWVPDPEALLVAYGLLGAGVAVALQDVFKNVAGSIAIFVSRPYEVGNRIELDGVFGDVIDIGLFYTTLLEVREWVAGDQATGRITYIPNGRMLSGTLNNYTKDHHFLWDELAVAITSESDFHEAMRIMLEVASDKTAELTDQARKSLSQLEKRYYLEDRTLEPSVHFTLAKDGYLLSLRFVVEVRERRGMQTDLLEAIVEQFNEHPRIAIAPNTIAPMEYPDVSAKKKRVSKKKSKESNATASYSG